jgi:hypothetical protein
MRHEVRDRKSLYFTLEIILGGVGITGLSPTCSVFSISAAAANKWWDASGAGVWGIAKVDNPMVEQSPGDHPGLYWLDTIAGTANNMYDAGEALVPSANADGYLIRIEEPVNNILEYIHVIVSDQMIVDANVVQWGGATPTLEVGTNTNFPVISVGGWKDNITMADQATTGSQSPSRGTISVFGETGGTTFRIDATDYVENVDWFISGTGDLVATAESIRDAINLGPDATASVTDDVVYVTHNTPGAIGVTFTLPVGAGLTLSGSGTLTNGPNQGLPNISVHAWQDELTNVSFSGNAMLLPSVSVESWSDTPVSLSPGGVGAGGFKLPAITVEGWGGHPGVKMLIGTDTEVPSISVRGWHDAGTGEDGIVYGKIRSDASVTRHSVWPSVNVYDWNGENTGGGPEPWETVPNDGSLRASLDVGLNSRMPKITVSAWDDQDGGHNTDGTDINTGVATDIAVTWTPDQDPFDDTGGTIINRPNVRTQIVADKAIDASAIDMDAVTYDELADSAIAEIVNGVWNASIAECIDGDLTNPGTNKHMADIGTMGHKMFIDYFAQYMVHLSPDGGNISATPAHGCSTTQPEDTIGNGTKFYSGQLAASNLTDDQIKSYIDRTATLLKRLDVGQPGGVPQDLTVIQQYLVRIHDVGMDDPTDPATQHFVIKLVDEDESPIPGGVEGPDFTSYPDAEVFDYILIKGETDPTMHEVAHAVWEESVCDHETPNTFGMFSRIMTGLTQYNHRITSSIYDETGRLLSCRLVVYPSAEDAENETNALTTVEVSSTYDEKQNMETFLAKSESSEECP